MKTLITLLLLALPPIAAQAEKRVALVIGCENYGSANTLKNPKNDAALLAGKLKQLRFDSVLSFTDVNAKTFNRKLEEFKAAAFQSDVAVFYFAGHGMEVEDVNYLLPTDAVLEEAADLKQEAVSLPDVLKLLTEAQVKAKVVILDCCRNNPFANAQKERAWMRSRAFRSGGDDGGLADVKTDLLQGTVIMFAAEPGKKAKDGPAGGNSPFAKALEASMGLSKKDGSGPLDVYHTMTSVANAVRAATGGAQKPWLKFDGQPQLMEELAFATVSLGRTESPVPPMIIPQPPVVPAVPVDPFIGTTAGQTKENSQGTVFRWCPPGEFYMGSSSEDRTAFARDGVTTDDEVQHKVKLTRGFWLSQNACTQGEWEAVMGRTLKDQARLMLQDDTKYNIGGKQTTLREFKNAARDSDPEIQIAIQSPSIPIYYVSWEDAVEYCRKLTAREQGSGRLPTGWRYALPTEAQWEYACRADTETTLYNGSMVIKGKANAPALDAIAWYAGNSSVGYEGRGWDTKDWPEKQYPGGNAGPRKVGQKKPNAWGLCDMIGNVYQWCADYYGPYETGISTDPTGPATGVLRVDRGGSWNDYAAYCRAAYRLNDEPGLRYYFLGFRPALVPSR